MEPDVTVVITSCGRYDLLEQTLRSFRIFNTDQGVARMLVVEDGDGEPREICERYRAELMRVGEQVGQAAAIDRAYRTVGTPYVFHCEDDWEFYREEFIERSRRVLEIDKSCVCVWLRAWDDLNGHPLSFASRCRSFGVLAYGYLERWHGFTWNPGLRRLSDYLQIESFARFARDGHEAEGGANEEYRKLGYRAVILDETGYVRHIGYGRTVR